MPAVGTVVHVQFKTGALVQFGQKWDNVPGAGSQYSGKVIGVFYVPASSAEPEHYDVIGVPDEVFQFFLEILQGHDESAVLKRLEAKGAEMLAKKATMSGIRRMVFLDGHCAAAFADATLTLDELWSHYNDRRLAAALAFADDDDDDEDDEPAAADGATPAAPAAPPSPVLPGPVAQPAYAPPAAAPFPGYGSP